MVLKIILTHFGQMMGVYFIGDRCYCILQTTLFFVGQAIRKQYIKISRNKQMLLVLNFYSTVYFTALLVLLFYCRLRSLMGVKVMMMMIQNQINRAGQVKTNC